MPDFNHIKEICSSNSALTADVVDKFLLYYAAQENKTDKEFEKRLKRFNHVLSKFPTEFVGLIKAQYIAHRVFRQCGRHRGVSWWLWVCLFMQDKTAM